MTSNSFLMGIKRQFDAMIRYEDPALHRKALRTMPIPTLEKRAIERLRTLQQQVKEGKCSDVDVSIQELLLLELLDWFKYEFFEWVDSPACAFCGSATRFVNGGGNVEQHQCGTCGQLTDFVRHSDPGKALAARRGRCGEWAAAFTLLCRALSWPARLILAAGADHAWTEVWCATQNRWLHCDPCEALCDVPLLYEAGWGRQLSYVIAYSYEDVQDVTWRYTSNHQAVLFHRTACSESALISTLLNLRLGRLQQFSIARRVYLSRRTLRELVELMLEKQPTEADKQGRTSGSLAWRQQRGESNVNTGHTWLADAQDIIAGEMVVRYSPTLDVYEKLRHNSVVQTIKQWNTGVFNATSIFRKEEKDWKVVYLCREESVAEGKIQWRFSSANKVFDKVTIRCDNTIFENGQVQLHVSGNSKLIDFSSTGTLSTQGLSGSQEITISASLTGGQGNCAWQHAQLFRRSLTSSDYPFSVTLTFK